MACCAPFGSQLAVVRVGCCGSLVAGRAIASTLMTAQIPCMRDVAVRMLTAFKTVLEQNGCAEDYMPLCPYSDDPWAPPFEELMANFDFPVRVGNTDTRGRGLFATRPIAQDQVITLYPCHAVQQPPVHDRMSPYTAANNEDIQAATSELNNPYHATLLRADSYVPPPWTIFGNPAKVDRPWACGHMVNDPHPNIASMNKTPATPREAGRAYMEYILRIKPNANAFMTTIVHGFAVGVLATRAIQAGEEILAPYGYEYWCGDAHAIMRLMHRFVHEEATEREIAMMAQCAPSMLGSSQ